MEPLFDYIFPLLYISRIFGLSHFSVESKKLSVFWILYSLLLILSMNCLAIYQIYLEITDESNSKLYKFVFSLRVLSLVVSTNCIFLVFILKYEIIVEFLTCVCDVESVIKNHLNVPLSKGLYVKFQVIALFIIAVAVGVRVFLIYILQGFIAGFLNLFSIISYLSQAQFISCVILLNQYLTIINNKLLHIKELKYVLVLGSENPTTHNNLDLNVGKRQKVEDSEDVVLGTCIELVRYISIIKDNLNSYFSFPILLVLGDNLLLTTFNLYMLIKNFSFTSNNIELIQLGCYFYVVVINIIQVVYLAFPCAVADDLLMLLSKQLLHIDMTYTACGFFILNESLLTSVFGAISTQLVILLQFGT